MHVFCDFDGTISLEDATDFILERLASPAWEDIEQQWKQGLIGSAECMARQIALIEATRQELDGALNDIAIDPTFPAFIDFCWAQGIPVTIISDGVDYFIKRILARHNLDYLPVIANKLTISGVNGHTRYELSSPYSDIDCSSAAGVCKCRSVEAFDTRVYIGDGRSDFCVSDKPELVFAKDKLAEFCTQQAIPFVSYGNFSDLTQSLKNALPGFNRHHESAPRYATA